MKLTDFLEDIGRPIAYYPSMRKITGGTTATVMLCQFIYWRGKEADPDGWLYKDSEEITKETGLSYDEQKTARRQLKEAGLLEEHYARLDHQMKFRLKLDAINEAWAACQDPIPESGNAMFGKAESGDSLNSNTENTTENNVSSIVEEANKKVDAILEMERQAQEAIGKGAWTGREMVPNHLLTYADWWHGQTGQTMKGKLNKEWVAAFMNWLREELSLAALQEAYDHTKGWKKIVAKPSEITAQAIAIQALPKPNEAAPVRAEGQSSGYFA